MARPNDRTEPAQTDLESDTLPAVPTPDQTRRDGLIPDPGTLARSDTSGIIEDRKRKGNLTGM